MLQSVTEYCRVLQSITEYYRALQSIYRVLQSITEYYRVLHGITKYYKVLQSITKTKTNLAHLLGPTFGLVSLILRIKVFKEFVVEQPSERTMK